MSHDEIIAVIQARRDGKEIEARLTEAGAATQRLYNSSSEHDKQTLFQSGAALKMAPVKEGVWLPPISPTFNFVSYDYRIKPEPPKPREWWIMPGPICVIRGSQSEVEPKSFIHVREVPPKEG